MRYGPQLSLAELQKQFARVAADGKLDIHFRHYLNQFALWADEREIINLAIEHKPAEEHEETRRNIARAREDQLRATVTELKKLRQPPRISDERREALALDLWDAWHIALGLPRTAQINPAHRVAYLAMTDAALRFALNLHGAGGAASSSPSSSGG